VVPSRPSNRAAFGRLAAACACVFACGAGAVLAAGANELHATAKVLESQPRVELDGRVTTRTTRGAAAVGRARTILLIGSDRRAGAAARDARSDTMLLVRLSPRAKAVTLLSVPRDLKVTLNGGPAKINAAYALGGARLTVKTLRRVLGVEIDHVIDVDFAGFRALVDQLGCVYTDVDRRYYNRNVGTAATNYASIDIRAGYQRLCGADALDYVRYRHGDNDLVRAARQRDFLRQARARVNLGDRHELLRLLGEHTRTDIRGTAEVAALAKLALDASRKPVQEVPFPATIGPSCVYADPAAIHRAVRRFLHPRVAAATRAADAPAARRAAGAPAATRAARRPRRAQRAARPARATRPRAPRLVRATAPRLRASFGLLYPTRRLPGATLDSARAYTLKDADGRSHRAYRLSIRAGVGEYYGVQGTDWTAPPLLAEPGERRRLGGRTFELYYDGRRLRRVALRSATGTWWVTNTLTLKLSNAQMLAIARSLRTR